MNQLALLQDLAVVLATAGVVALMCQKIGVPLVVGYLLAGILIGPYTFSFTFLTSIQNVHTLADLGLVFVMLFVGLNLSLPRLRQLGPAPIIATALSALLLVSGCRAFGPLFGLSGVQSLFLAGALVVSSSAIISRVLDESGASRRAFGQLALTVTVLEDWVAVAMLAILGSYAASTASVSAWQVVGKLGGFVLLTLVVLLLVVPRLLARLRAHAPREIEWLAVGGLSLGAGWLAARVGFSVALGSFLVGSTIGGTAHKARLEQAFEGLRDIFAAVFFVSMGMLFDVALIAEALPLALGLTAIALVGRFLSTSSGLLLAGKPMRDAVQAGVALQPLGELSFVVAQLGVSTGLMPRSFFPACVGAALLTTLLSPVLSKLLGERLAVAFEAREPELLRSWRALLAALGTPGSQGGRGQVARRLVGGRLAQLVLEVAIWISLLAFSAPLLRAVQSAAVNMSGSLAWVLPIAFWVVFGVLMLIPLVAIWRNLGALGLILADALGVSSGTSLLSMVLERAFQAGGSLLLLLFSTMLLPSTAVPSVVVLPALAAWFAAALLLRGPLVRWYSRANAQVRAQLSGSEATTTTTTQKPRPLPKARVDWELRVHEHRLGVASPAVGRSLKDLGLRSRFGCTVASIDRQGLAIPSPSANTRLFPNDRLLLVGSEEQIERAEAWLSQVEPRKEAEDFSMLVNETIQVPDDFTHADETLEKLGIAARFGVQVLGIERNGHVVRSPSGSQCLRPGDRLIVLSMPSQNARFNTWLAEQSASAAQTFEPGPDAQAAAATATDAAGR
ncbi:MAG: cation:proton antiporter [Myxococcales bacterium]|jgi:CPA2 family monovalent cation:H+ antiporter-2